VPQFRQLHGTQALGRSILAVRAPDVLADLRAVGACEAASPPRRRHAILFALARGEAEATSVARPSRQFA
jgi:hypothetical protein